MKDYDEGIKKDILNTELNSSGEVQVIYYSKRAYKGSYIYLISPENIQKKR